MKAAFPHVLIKRSSDMDIVTDNIPVIGDKFHIGVVHNPKTDTVHQVYATITSLNTNPRPAKGDWSGWHTHPFWINVSYQKEII